MMATLGTGPQTPSPHHARLTIDAAAEYLGVGARFIQRLVAENRIRHLKLGNYCRISPEALDDYLENGGWTR